jgi:hypothetical protein
VPWSSNDTGSYSFNVSGEPVKEDDTDEEDDADDETERFLAAGCYYSDPKTCRRELRVFETMAKTYEDELEVRPWADTRERALRPPANLPS